MAGITAAIVNWLLRKLRPRKLRPKTRKLRPEN